MMITSIGGPELAFVLLVLIVAAAHCFGRWLRHREKLAKWIKHDPFEPCGSRPAEFREAAEDEPLMDGVYIALPNVEKVAEHAHDFWVREKVEGTPEVTTLVGSDGENVLVPYAQLTESNKRASCAMVANVYRAIRAVKSKQDDYEPAID